MIALMSDLSVFFLVGVAILLLASVRRRRLRGNKVAGLGLVPLVLGLTLALVIVFVLGTRLVLIAEAALEGSLFEFFPEFSRFILIAAAALAILLSELMAVVFPGRLSERLERRGVADEPRMNRVDVAGAALVLLLVAGPLALAIYDADSSVTTGTFTNEVVAEYGLPGPPMDYAPVDASTGYVSIATGEVYLIHFPANAGGEATFDLVADDLVFPRGIAVGDATLYVGDIGSLACDETFPTCFGHSVEGEREIIEASAGTVWAFDIDDDGTLANKRELLSDLPVVSSEHGVNDVEVGPDGYVYVSMGNIDWMWEAYEQVAEIDHPNLDTLGTILRVDPESGEYTIHASGMRNVFSIDVTSTGRIFGAENDGWTKLGWYPEAILMVTGGEDFGYPRGGGARALRDATPPLKELTLPGSSAIAWLEEGPWSGGLLIGGRDNLTYVIMGESGEYVFPAVAEAEIPVREIQGYITAIEPMGPDRVLIAVSGIYGAAESVIQILSMEGEPPAVAP
jgi:hypothetical protein